MLRSQRTGVFGVACLLAGVSFGCVGGSKGLSSDDKTRLQAYILEAPPGDMPHPLDINFENKVHLIGYKFEPETAHPGEDTKLTYYWRCDDTLEDGWLLFTHTKDAASGKMGNLDFVGPLREDKNGSSHQVLGPEKWEKGKVYVDEQTYKVPTDVTGSEVTVFVGIWKGDARLRIVSGPNDGDNSAIVGAVKTGVAQKADEHTSNDVPSLTLTKLAANDKITIDGKLGESEWGAATSTGPFVDVGSGKPNPASPVQGAAKLLWDDKHLYVAYEVTDPDAYVGFTNAKAQPDDYTAAGQPKLWTKDTVEMMVDPDSSGDNKDYYELQIGPQNKVFKSQFDTLQQPNGGPNGPFGHEDWEPKLKSAVALTKGADGKVSGYTVEIAIPWSAYAKAENHPPKPGDVWRVNFYAMKNNGGVAWSPILGQGNFHKATRFGKITWTVAGAPGATSDPVTGGGDGGAPVAALAGDSGMVPMPMPRSPLTVHLKPHVPTGPIAPAPPAP